MHTFSFGNGTNANIEFDYNDKDMGGWGLWVYWNSMGGGNKVTTTTPYTDGKWHHMALVRQGQVMKVYVDGKAIGASAYVPAINVSGLVKRTIGIQSGGSLAYLGWLDEVRMVKGAAKWTANFLPPTAAY